MINQKFDKKDFIERTIKQYANSKVLSFPGPFLPTNLLRAIYDYWGIHVETKFNPEDARYCNFKIFYVENFNDLDKPQKLIVLLDYAEGYPYKADKYIRLVLKEIDEIIDPKV